MNRARVTKNNLIYGEEPRPLMQGKLPTYRQIDLAVEYEIKKGKKATHIVSAALTKVTNDFLDIVKSISTIKTISKKNIIRKIEQYRKLRRNELRNLSIDSRNHKPRYQNIRHKKGKKNRLKSLGSKTVPLEELKDKIFDVYIKSSITSPSDIEFFKDQCGPRNMRRQPTISIQPSGDNNTSVDDQSVDESQPKVEASPEVSEESDEDDEDKESLDLDFSLPKAIERCKGKKIPDGFIEHIERYGISNKAAAGFLNMQLPDSISYTKSGILKHRKKRREDESCPDFSGIKVHTVGFDEKIDSIQPTRTDNITEEEHCSVIFYTETGEYFAGFFVPEGKKSPELAHSLYKFCLERKLNLTDLQCLITDGTNKMSGWITGAQMSFENEINRDLQRIFCFFHHLELSFKSILTLYGGDTSGPRSLEGEWGGLICDPDIHHRKIVKFKKIENDYLLDIIDNMPVAVVNDLSNDHKIFIDLVRTIITGINGKKVMSRIGPVVKSRFTTKEIRVCRAYISEKRPSHALVRVVSYIIFVWAPVYLKSKLSAGKQFMSPRLLLLEVQLSNRYLNNKELKALQVSLNTNGQMSHHEHTSLCMFHSDDEKERHLAVSTVLRIRRENKKTLRKFTPSEYMVNLKATNLADLNQIPFKFATSEPPALRHLTDEEIIAFLDKPMQSNFPIETVAVERAVKDVSRASKMANNTKERNGVVFLTKKARQLEKEGQGSSKVNV